MTSPNLYHDLGHNVFIEFVQTEGIVSGLAYEHPCKEGPSKSWIPFKGRPYGCDRSGWTVLQEDPLTLAPSLLCRTCGHHGFIQQGKWMPC